MTENSKIEELSDNLKEYARVQYEIILLQFTDKIAAFGSSMTLRLISAVIILNLLIFLGLAGGFYLATLTGNYYSGFLWIAFTYLAALIIFLLIRKKAIGEPLRDKIIGELLKNNEQ